MKTLWLTVALVFLTVAAALAQNSTPADTPYQIVSRGANFNMWQWQTYEPTPNGLVVAHTNSYTELASGLNYHDTNGLWVPSADTIEAFPGGAIVRHCQHSLIFNNNLNSPGAIDMETPDGKRLRSNILGLMYDDPTTGQAVQIAELQDSEGELIANNEVLYPNAFRGVSADVLYRNRLDGMEQNVILKEQLPAPETYGMNPDSTYLEVFTEFLGPPEASVVDLEADTQESDQAISWGATSLGRGKAFILGDEDAPTLVTKRYAVVGGRHFLLEKVRLKDIKESLSRLPQHASNEKRLPGMASKHFKFPKTPTAKSAARPMRLAMGLQPEKGYVLDYTSLGTAYTNFCFQGDTEYYVSSALNLSGTNNCFEGGTVIKYATNSSIVVTAGGSITFLSKPYRPVVFTAKDDNSISGSISGSTGNPSGYYADPALNIGLLGSITLSDFRIAYANRAISMGTAYPTIYDAQFVNCATVISDVSGTVSMGNVLFSNNKTNFNATSSANTVSVQNATFNNGFELMDGSFGSTTFYMTNCAFVNMTNLSGRIAAGGYNGFYQSPWFGSPYVTSSTYPLQQAGAANCYLTNGCAFVSAGTTNVSTNDLQFIQAKTSFAPVIFSNVTISVATNLSPRAQRDNGSNPNLGYHYDPLDYIFGGAIAQSNITFAAGTAVGFFFNTSGGAGLSLGDSVTASFNGTVTTPCHWTRYCTVQEGYGNWTIVYGIGGIMGLSYTNAAPAIQATFLDGSDLAVEGNLFRDDWTLLVDTFRHCEFYCGGVGGYYSSLNLTNCLFVNCAPYLYWNYGAANMTMDNCTVFRGQTLADNTSGQPWPVTIVNCAFDSTTFYMNAHGGQTNGYYTDYNSFLVGSNTTLYLGGHEVFVTNSYNWQTSWLGNYYQLTNSPLIDKGSTTADRLGLYHFTTQVSQMKETNSIVDIGYHYVAVNTNGVPFATNGDGIPDYWEDPDGNGLVESGEIGWNINGDLGLQVIISRPRNGSTLP